MMSSRLKSILIVGCFDTKGEDFEYLRTSLLDNNVQVITVNTGVLGTTNRFPVDYEAEQVAEAAGFQLADIRNKNDRGHAVEVMGKGAAILIGSILKQTPIAGVIGMGGGGGTYITLSAMQQVPFGIPKFCISTLATKDLSTQIGFKDITLMPSIVDVAGLNSISRVLIKQAAAAICAMAQVELDKSETGSGRIAISMFGNTSTCVNYCSDFLRQQGYEVMAFHANGTGGRNMEALINEGHFDAVLDITTTELADELSGGVCSAGPDRLKAAGAIGIPQVIVPGCIDMVNFSEPKTVPAEYADREFYQWAPNVTLMRTNESENRILGELLVARAEKSKAPVKIVLPLKGISQIDNLGGVFYRPEINQVLFDTIINSVQQKMAVEAVDLHINDKAFAEKLVGILQQLLQQDQQKNKI
jgi:uncharacterized protein (UPF0261 family)